MIGTQIMEVTTAILLAERQAFESLRDEVFNLICVTVGQPLIIFQVNAHTSVLRRNARIVDELDVTLAFAHLAEEMNFVRPIICDE